MYRDVAPEFDEHDGAVGAILIAESLIAGCERADKRLRASDHDPWLAVGDAQFFPEMWRHLDRAKRVLQKRGTSTAAYDDLRPNAKTILIHTKNGKPVLDGDALDQGRRAVEILKLAIPGADWAAIEKRTAGLVAEPQLKRRNYMFVGAIVGAFALVSIVWTTAFAPRKHVKANPRLEMRTELADIAYQRKLKIADLRMKLGDKCIPVQAHELVESLALDGQSDEARAFGEGYIERCGDDIVVSNWAHAPKPRTRHRR